MQYSKNTSFAKAFTSVLKRFFRTRSIIIISEQKVGHVPLSGLMQVLILVGLLGFFSGASYITGSYMSARNAIREKDKKIVSSNQEKTRISEEMGVLKHDLIKLSQNGKDLSAYSKFIIDRYVNDNSHESVLNLDSTQLSTDNLFGQNSNELLERIADLQSRVDEARTENDRLVIAIRERTNKKIDYFEDIISSTGLDSDRLEHLAATGAGKPGTDISRATQIEPVTDESRSEPRPHAENQGGPFIPYESASLTDVDQELLSDIDRMVLLHDIVDQLPLSHPISDAQMTGPFGKRVDPLNGRMAIHPGVDLAGPTGSKIYCTSAGKVTAAERRIAYGNMVDIDHGFGITTRYAHMSKILVHEGDMVHKGQLIGIQGSTGRSTGPHLHYEVRINDHPVNPVKFLDAGEYVSENK